MRRMSAMLTGLAAATLALGVPSYPYWDDSKWSNVEYGSNRHVKDRTRQWVGHSQKILAIRRKRNKAAKQARKIQRRRIR